MDRFPLLLRVLLLLVAPPAVTATFSIVAADGRTRQVGGAGASCNPSGDVYGGLYLAAPNRSALHTQALYLERDGPIVRAARTMMRDGEDAGTVLAAMEGMDGGNRTLSVGNFPSVELRQYGMADFDTNGGYTGRSLEAVYREAGMAEGTEQVDLGPDRPVDGRYSYRAMGNDVAAGTTASLQAGFLEVGADEGGEDGPCALARRLLSAMDAVLRDGGGDMRCLDGHGGIAATGAYLHVDEPDGRVLVHINKAGDGSYEPIEALRREFRRWEEGHGCGRVDVDGGVDGGGGGGGATTGTGGGVPGAGSRGGDGAAAATATVAVAAGTGPGGGGGSSSSSSRRSGLVSAGLGTSLVAIAAAMVAVVRAVGTDRKTTPESSPASREEEGQRMIASCV